VRILNQKNIMIVEDEPDHIELIKLVLKHNNYNISSCMDGLESVDIINNTMPDLVILDIMLPGLSGFEVCRRIKQSPKTSGIPVIMISVKAEDEDKENGIKSGADLYLSKPFNFYDLVSNIKTLLKE